MSDCDIAGLNGLYPRSAPVVRADVSCSSSNDCGGGACSRPEVDTDRRVCCASGQEALTWGCCTKMASGARCHTDGQRASGSCDHNTWNRIGRWE